MADEVKVLGVGASPFSLRVEIALKMKGVPYEFFEEDLSNKSPLLLKYNPVHKKIPVLVHNEKPIAESQIILQYIDETWKDNPILPQDPYEKAISLFWAKFIDEKCLPAVWNACLGLENQEKAIEEASSHLETLENELKDKRFFGGDKIGFVGIVADFIAFWLKALQEVVGLELLTQEKFPILFKWSDEFVNCTIIKENLPPREKVIGYYKTLIEFGSINPLNSYCLFVGSALTSKVTHFLTIITLDLSLVLLTTTFALMALGNSANLRPLIARSSLVLDLPLFLRLDQFPWCLPPWAKRAVARIASSRSASSSTWRETSAKFLMFSLWVRICLMLTHESDKEKAIEEACGHLKTLENELKDERYFGGDKIGFADIVADFIGFWLRALQEVVGLELLTQENFPTLFKWSDEFVNCNIIKENLPPREILIGYYQAHLACNTAY
ncbi:LOW QUALITY PROTEIN: GST_C domain-containing protein/GST_N_3 domain-containing protein, partial [Cephalotus follicularis]